MKFPEYNEQMQRLVKVYGQARYPEERITMIFESIGSIDLDTMKKQVSYFIGSMERGPLLNDFIDALGSVLQDAKKKAIEEKLKHLPSCINCNGTGHVTMYEKKSGWEFAFQCQCPRGALLQPGFPKQFLDMGSIYASQRAWAAGKFDRIEAIRNAKKIVAS